MLLGKAHKYLQNERYQDALDKALQASKLKLEEQFEWLCHSIEGKARFHLGDEEKALRALRRAQTILASRLEKEADSKPLQNIVNDINHYIDKIEKDDIQDTRLDDGQTTGANQR